MTFRALCADDSVWRNLFRLDFPHSPVNFSRTWRENYTMTLRRSQLRQFADRFIVKYPLLTSMEGTKLPWHSRMVNELVSILDTFLHNHTATMSYGLIDRNDLRNKALDIPIRFMGHYADPIWAESRFRYNLGRVRQDHDLENLLASLGYQYDEPDIDEVSESESETNRESESESESENDDDSANETDESLEE